MYIHFNPPKLFSRLLISGWRTNGNRMWIESPPPHPLPQEATGSAPSARLYSPPPPLLSPRGFTPRVPSGVTGIDLRRGEATLFHCQVLSYQRNDEPVTEAAANSRRAESYDASH